MKLSNIKIVDQPLIEYAKQLNKNSKIIVSYFGSSIQDPLVDYCLEQVLKGEKCGTTSLYKAYIAENEPIPKINDLMIVKNSKNEQIALIQNTQVSICKFNEVTEQMAYIEGEKDKTLKTWQSDHIKFFCEQCENHQLDPFIIDDLVVFEQFKLIAIASSIAK